MEVSLVNINNLGVGLRLDSEYYKPEFLAVETLLKNKQCMKLDDISKSIKSFGAYSLCNQIILVEKGIPFIRCKDIKEGFIDFSNVQYIDEGTNKLLVKSAVKPKMVMLTMSGTVGNSAIAADNWQYPINSNQDIAKIEVNSLASPYYLTIFFSSRYGKAQTERLPVGSIQQHIFLWQLKEMLVFIPSKGVQDIIEKTYLNAMKLLNESYELYNQAEQILLLEIGLANWKPKHQLFFVKKFSDTKASDRIDADYFQPVYDEVIKKVKQNKNGYKTLDDSVFIKKCIEPGSDAYQEKGIPFLRVSNLSKFGVNNDNQQYLSEELYEKLKNYQPKKGEILLSKDATPGIAYHLNDEPHQMIPSGGILRLKIKDVNHISSEFLTLVLNSIVVQKQIERDIGGSIINHWLVNQVKETIIPVLPDLVQEEITGKIAESFIRREQSKKLLDIAKRGVEMAIEKSEDEALKWINQEVKAHT